MKGFSQWRTRGALVWGVCLTAVAVMFVVGCGGGGGGGGSFLTLSGDVTVPSGTRQAAGGYALADAQVKAYIWPDFANPVAQGTTDSNGHYMLTLPETAVGKDIVVVATKQVGGKTVRVEAISPDLPHEGRNNVNLDAYTTFATEEIARIREQEGLSDLSAGGVATVVERIRGELPSWNGHLGDVLPPQIGGGLADNNLQQQVQDIVQQYKGALKGSTGNPDVDTARRMMQTIRDMGGTVVGSGRDEGNAIDTALNLTQNALDAQLSATEAFGKRFDILMDVLNRLGGQPPAEYRLVRDSWGWLQIQRVGDIPGGKTWKVTSQVEGESNGLVVTVTVEQPIETFYFDPTAGKYTITATKSGVNYSATLTPTINEANRSIQLNASINLQDNALSQPITFNGTLTATFAQLPSGDAPPQMTSATFNGTLGSQFGTAQVTNLRAEFDPDSSQQDSLKRLSLQSLQAQTTARPLSLSLQGVDIPFMRLQGGGTTPTQVTINTLQVTGRDKNDKSISLTISNVSGTFEEYRDPVSGKGSGVIKTLQGRINFASSGRLTLSGEVNGTWNNPVPFESSAGRQLSTFPDGTIRIQGNMTPAIGKPAAVEMTFTSSPKDSTPKMTASVTLSYGGESMAVTIEATLAEDLSEGVYPAVATMHMTHSPSGMTVDLSAERGQPFTGTIKKADGTKVADIGEAQALGITELGHVGIVKYVDGTFETLESLLP